MKLKYEVRAERGRCLDLVAQLRSYLSERSKEALPEERAGFERANVMLIGLSDDIQRGRFAADAGVRIAPGETVEIADA